MAMGAWRDLGHGWVVGNQSAVCGLAACGPLPLPFSCPSLSLSLFLFWQKIIRGFMQITYCSLKWSGKTCPVNAMCISEPCSTPRRCTRSCMFVRVLCLSLIMCVCVFYLYIVFGVAPVPFGVQVAQTEALQLAKVNLCHRAADLTRHKVWT